MQLWHLLIEILTTTALLIPIGALGVFRWLMWLAKRIPALFYHPIHNDYDTSATIVTPVYMEDPDLFRRALDSWIANAPDRYISLVKTYALFTLKEHKWLTRAVAVVNGKVMRGPETAG